MKINKPYIMPLIIVAMCAVIAITQMNPPSITQITEFYILGSGVYSQHYPATITVADEISVKVGIKNHEQKAIDYQIEVRIDGEMLVRKDAVLLEEEGVWEDTLRFAIHSVGERQKVEVFLFKNNNPNSYRQLHLFLDVSAKP